MKVCYVTHLPNLTGASQSLLDILAAFGSGEYGIEPYVLLGKSGPIEKELKKRNIPYKIIRYTSEISDKRFYVTWLKRLRNRIAVRKVAAWFREEQFDLIHNNTLLSRVGMEAAKQCGIPYISHNREFVWEDHHIKLLKEQRSYRLMESAARCIAISRSVYEKFHALVPNANFITLADGLVVENYLADHKPLFDGDKVNVLLAGRIAPGKGQMEALEAFRILQKQGHDRFALKIVGNPGKGDTEYAENLHRFVAEHDLTNVEFLGFSDLKALRAEADIALVCSSSEALGRVTIESQLAGCLTIGADAAATTDLIRDGETGLLYASGHASDLADQLTFAANHSDKMRHIAKQGQEYAKNTYSIDRYVSKLKDLYEQAVR